MSNSLHLWINVNQISDGNNNNGQSRRIKKCLFGPADPDETFKLLDEQFKSERERFKRRFGIEMDELESVAKENHENGSPKRRKVIKAKSRQHTRAVLKPHNGQQQSKMTDFCQVKKKAPGQPQQPQQCKKL